MSGNIHTAVFRESHPYTRAKVPWKLESDMQSEKSANNGSFGWRLFHYIAGGGSRQFGRSAAQDEREYRQKRFLIKSAIVGVLWLLFYIF